MITVTFLNGCILATAEQSLWQYSYNQQLQINGLELPGVFTVDFCNEGDTTTVAMIGSSGVVGIPNELLTSGRDIVAYVFQKSVLTGGITRCEIRIDVLTRPERDDETPTPEQEAVIDQYIAELNEGVEQAETAAANAQTSENNAAASAADAQQSKADAAASASAAAGSASDASNSAAAAAQSAVNASNSAENAAEAASEGIGYKEDSEAWAIGKRGGVDVGSSDETYHNNSKYYASQAAASSSAANSEAAAAAQSARDAAASANGAAQSAASATASKNAAANSADIAANAATAAQNHAISAASSATAAGGSATAAANKATAAAQSATAAGNSATEAATAREAAEDAQDAAEAAAQSIAQSAAQIAQNTSDIGDLTSQINTLQPAATAADIGKALIVKTVADGKPTEYEYGEAGGGGDASNYAPIIINSASGDIASFADGADGLPIEALSVNVEPIQDLHGYDSPWPAGGGKNLLDPSKRTVYSDGKGQRWYESDGFTLKANQVYTFSVTYANPIALYIRSKSDGTNLATGNHSTTYTPSEDTVVYFQAYRGENISPVDTFQLELGSAATPYAPYSNICPISGRTSVTIYHSGADTSDPTTYTIQLGDTVYGGKLDVTGGKMVVDRALATLTGSEVWYEYASFQGFYTGLGRMRNGIRQDGISNMLVAFKTSDYGQKNTMWLGVNNQYFYAIGVYETMGSTLADFKSYLATNNLQVVYPLAAPIEITLTPTQIDTLLGTNNIWSDAGDVSVDYRADTKLYIDNIHQPTDNDMTADAQIASGKYFLIGGNLYKSTTVIPAGDTIRPGTNCMQTNLAEALNALNT